MIGDKGIIFNKNIKIIIKNDLLTDHIQKNDYDKGKYKKIWLWILRQVSLC